jgi:hypothetical protein
MRILALPLLLARTRAVTKETLRLVNDVARKRNLRYTMPNGRLHDASTRAPVDGRGGAAPRSSWTDMRAGLPAQTTEAGCAACR